MWLVSWVWMKLLSLLDRRRQTVIMYVVSSQHQQNENFASCLELFQFLTFCGGAGWVGEDWKIGDEMGKMRDG